MDHLWSPWRYQYVQKERTGSGCVFCQVAASARDEENLVVYRARKNYIILNLYPYSTGHLMVVPYEHVDRLGDHKLRAGCPNVFLVLGGRSGYLMRIDDSPPVFVK